MSITIGKQTTVPRKEPHSAVLLAVKNESKTPDENKNKSDVKKQKQIRKNQTEVR
jgi:hypothetical protein